MTWNKLRLTRGAALALTLVLSAGMLSGCSTFGGDSEFKAKYILSGGRDLEAEKKGAEIFAPVMVCPPVQVRDGTQLLRVFERGKQDDFSAIRFQASIGKFARECHSDTTGTTTIKVGVAGRMLSGPNGATGTATLPLRVVLVRNGDEVLASQLYKIDATIPAGMAAVDWSKIIDGLVVPGDKIQGNFVIYVGFDEAGAKASGKGKG